MVNLETLQQEQLLVLNDRIKIVEDQIKTADLESLQQEQKSLQEQLLVLSDRIKIVEDLVMRNDPTQLLSASSLIYEKLTMKPYLKDINYDTHYIDIFDHLFQSCQTLYGQKQNVAEQFCQEVELATQKKASLCLSEKEQAPDEEKKTFLVDKGFISFPVQGPSFFYGYLKIRPRSEQSRTPSLPLDVSFLLAEACGWLLNALDISMFLLVSSDNHLPSSSVSLTKREKEVLQLMNKGYNHKEIAEKLHIAPKTVIKHKQHIYYELGVHNERDALLKAYQTGLFSFITQHFAS
jgi:DNA-binding CsgD family transcriptional regulator